MVTSDYDEVENDQRRPFERKCKNIQKILDVLRQEIPLQDNVKPELATCGGS